MTHSTFQGGCHCGAVRYQASVDIEKPVSCNCSICQKTGTLLAFTPESEFTLLQGGEALSDYQFNKKIIHHLFCKHCGIRSFSKGTGPNGEAMVAINVRCLDNCDIDQLKPTHFNGKDY